MKKTRELHDNEDENISGKSIGGAALVNFFVPDAALIQVNTVFMLACVLLGEQNKETILLSIIT